MITPNLIREVIDRRIESTLRNSVFTSIPATVLNVSDYEGQCIVDVQPCLADINPSDNIAIPFPVIPDVPVMVYSGGGAVVTVPIAVGDKVWLQFSMRNMENWLEGDEKNVSIPNDTRTFHLKDAVAFPCVYQKTNNPNPNPDDLELRYNDSIVRLKKDGNITISTKGNIVVEEAVDIEINNSGNMTINTEGNTEINVTGTTTLTSNGDVTIDTGNTTITGDLRVDGGVSVGEDVNTDSGISLNNHPHVGNLGANTSPPLPG